MIVSFIGGFYFTETFAQHILVYWWSSSCHTDTHGVLSLSLPQPSNSFPSTHSALLDIGCNFIRVYEAHKVGRSEEKGKKYIYGLLIAVMVLVPGRVIDISEASSVSLYYIRIPLSLSWLKWNRNGIKRERDIERFTDCCWVEIHSVSASGEKKKEQLDKKMSAGWSLCKKWIICEITLTQYGLAHRTASSVNTVMIQNALSCWFFKISSVSGFKHKRVFYSAVYFIQRTD